MENMSHRVRTNRTDESLRTIVVAGASSGVGKTLVAEVLTGLLARRQHPTAAAKITVTHGERGCPHGGKGCNVCSSLGGDFQIITRKSIIEQEGTDTSRLSKAGAQPVVWAITRDLFVAETWRAIRPLMLDASFAVIESNTLALTIKPTLTLMIVDPSVSRKLWKTSAEHLIRYADHVIFNDRGTAEKRAILLDEIEQVRGTANDLIFTPHPSKLAEHPAIIKSLDKLFVAPGH
jgi:hypothetical protein